MPRPRHPAAKALAVALLSFCSSVLAQDAQIRALVELVLVPVTVKGPKGVPATGLAKEAFSVKEAGKAQTLMFFSIEPVPISAAILIDTGVSETAFTRVKNSFPALIGAFADDDEVALYRFEKSVDRLTEFTADFPRVSTAMSKIVRSAVAPTTSASGPFSNPGPVINGVPVIPGVQSAGRSAAPPTKVLHDAVFQAAEDLATREINRRRIVIVISDGQNQNSLHSSDAALERLLTHDVQVFSVGVDATVFQKLRSPLGSYAKDTGGEAWFPDSQSGLESCYSLSTDTARNQYVLGYVSSSKRPATKPVFREIKVQVSLKGGEIRHKRGYYQTP